ncbi:hypothetical protein WA158_002926 [Blastocystis sp. Blastoise]
MKACTEKQLSYTLSFQDEVEYHIPVDFVDSYSESLLWKLIHDQSCENDLSGIHYIDYNSFSIIQLLDIMICDKNKIESKSINELGELYSTYLLLFNNTNGSFYLKVYELLIVKVREFFVTINCKLAINQKIYANSIEDISKYEELDITKSYDDPHSVLIIQNFDSKEIMNTFICLYSFLNKFNIESIMIIHSIEGMKIDFLMDTHICDIYSSIKSMIFVNNDNHKEWIQYYISKHGFESYIERIRIVVTKNSISFIDYCFDTMKDKDIVECVIAGLSSNYDEEGEEEYDEENEEEGEYNDEGEDEETHNNTQANNATQNTENLGENPREYILTKILNKHFEHIHTLDLQNFSFYSLSPLFERFIKDITFSTIHTLSLPLLCDCFEPDQILPGMETVLDLIKTGTFSELETLKLENLQNMESYDTSAVIYRDLICSPGLSHLKHIHMQYINMSHVSFLEEVYKRNIYLHSYNWEIQKQNASELIHYLCLLGKCGHVDVEKLSIYDIIVEKEASNWFYDYIQSASFNRVNSIDLSTFQNKPQLDFLLNILTRIIDDGVIIHCSIGFYCSNVSPPLQTAILKFIDNGLFTGIPSIRLGSSQLPISYIRDFLNHLCLYSYNHNDPAMALDTLEVYCISESSKPKAVDNFNIYSTISHPFPSSLRYISCGSTPVGNEGFFSFLSLLQKGYIPSNTVIDFSQCQLTDEALPRFMECLEHPELPENQFLSLIKDLYLSYNSFHFSAFCALLKLITPVSLPHLRYFTSVFGCYNYTEEEKQQLNEYAKNIKELYHSQCDCCFS